MTDQFDLFGNPAREVFDVPIRPAEPGEDVFARSYGRRLTEKLRAQAEMGVNPLVGTRGPEGGTCGDCAHRQIIPYHNGSYPKCDLGPATHGAKTDVRRYWPACHRYEATP